VNCYLKNERLKAEVESCKMENTLTNADTLHHTFVLPGND